MVSTLLTPSSPLSGGLCQDLGMYKVTSFSVVARALDCFYHVRKRFNVKVVLTLSLFPFLSQSRLFLLLHAEAINSKMLMSSCATSWTSSTLSWQWSPN